MAFHLPYTFRTSQGTPIMIWLTMSVSQELTIQLLKTHLVKAQHRMVQQANKHWSDRVFSVGDQVFLKLHPFRKNLINNSYLHKLAARYFGPFEIVKCVGQVAYELKLPSGFHVHPVFRVSPLKRAASASVSVSISLLVVDDEGRFVLEPFSILGRKLVQCDHLLVTQVRVQRCHSQLEDANWEYLSAIQQQFPTFNMAAPASRTILMDKDLFGG